MNVVIHQRYLFLLVHGGKSLYVWHKHSSVFIKSVMQWPSAPTSHRNSWIRSIWVQSWCSFCNTELVATTIAKCVKRRNSSAQLRSATEIHLPVLSSSLVAEYIRVQERKGLLQGLSCSKHNWLPNSCASENLLSFCCSSNDFAVKRWPLNEGSIGNDDLTTNSQLPYQNWSTSEV